MKIAKFLALFFGLSMLSACAFVSSHTVTPIVTIQGTNVVVRCQTTDARAWTFFDSSSDVTKFHNSSAPSTFGTNTYGPGTAIAGVNEQSSASNLVQILNAAAAIASKMP